MDDVMAVQVRADLDVERPRVLVVDDEWTMRDVIRMLLEDCCDVVTAADLSGARDALKGGGIDVVLLDIILEHESGVNFLDEMAQKWPDVPVVMTTCLSGADVIGECLRLGAVQYLTKPFNEQSLLTATRAALRQREARRDEQQEMRGSGWNGLIGTTPAMQRLYADLALAAQSGAHVLLVGETGTGKELAAQAIHDLCSTGVPPVEERWHGLPVHDAQSADHRDCGAGILPAGNSESVNMQAGCLHHNKKEILPPFISVNCGAIPPTLAESALFGHVKGAFTGADQDNPGYFGAAAGGSLLLDEFEDLPLPLQSKLLRVIERREYFPVGSSKTVKTDTRLIFACNEDPVDLVAAGRLRKDLYYRLQRKVIEMPPLRDRIEDIPLLAEHFVRQYNAEHSGANKRLSPEALDYLMQPRYWEGNVRDLENAVMNALERTDTAVVGCRALREYLEKMPVSLKEGDLEQCIGQRIDAEAEGTLTAEKLTRMKDELARLADTAALKRWVKICKGNISEIAKLTGLSRTAIHNMIKRTGITIQKNTNDDE